jgi:hypothetical protein
MRFKLVETVDGGTCLKKVTPDVNDIDNWTRKDIREFYDLNPNLTILTLAGMLGLTGGELKEILWEDV